MRTFYHTARFAATIRRIFGRIVRTTNDARTMKNENELTLTAILLGIAISVVFGAANAYLGLRVGLTPANRSLEARSSHCPPFTYGRRKASARRPASCSSP